MIIARQRAGQLHTRRVLITGDIAAEYEGEVVLGVINLDRAQAAASFRRLADLNAGVACFGHGEPVIGDAQDRLQQAAATLNVE